MLAEWMKGAIGSEYETKQNKTKRYNGNAISGLWQSKESKKNDKKILN